MNPSVLVSYALPPVLGAVIGYVTNAIAIKMLFRPYRAWRILGVRLPFTPGIIPRRRGQLAESMGRMVSEELLAVESVRAHMSSEGFVTSIREGVYGLIDRTLGKPLSQLLAGGVTESEQGGLIRRTLAKAGESAAFQAALTDLVSRGLERLGESRVDELLDLGDDTLVDALVGFVRSRLGDEEKRRDFETRLSNWMVQTAEENRELGAFLPDGTAAAAAQLADRLYPSMSRALLEWLSSDAMRGELARHGRRFLRGALDRLTTVQKLFVAAAQYDRQLETKMPGIVDDALREVSGFLEEPETRLRLCRSIETKVEELRRRGLGEVLAAFGLDDGEHSAASLAGRLTSALSSPTGEHVMRVVLQAFLQPVQRRTVGEILSEFTSVRALAERFSDLMCRRLRRLASRPSSDSDRRGAFPDSVAAASPAEMLGIDDAAKLELSEWVSERVLGLVHERVPVVLASLDVKSLVVNRIDGLDVAQVEGLLMRVIRRHLKWINVFGAILGALIGLLQIAMRLFGW